MGQGVIELLLVVLVLFVGFKYLEAKSVARHYRNLYATVSYQAAPLQVYADGDLSPMRCPNCKRNY